MPQPHALDDHRFRPASTAGVLAMRRAGCRILNTPVTHATTLTWKRTFKSHFGSSVEIAAQLFQLLVEGGLRSRGNFRTDHVLWALFHLKVYATEEVSARAMNTSKTSFKRAVDPIVRAIALLQLVGAFLSWVCR
jgi:hypothetical protein